jgi:hypothetical protein
VAVGHVLGLECKSFQNITGMRLVHNLFSVSETGAVTERKLGGSGSGTSKQTLLPMYKYPPTPLLMAVAVHPMKSPLEFFNFCSQVESKVGGLWWCIEGG